MTIIEHWIDGSPPSGESTRTGLVWNPATGASYTRADVVTAGRLRIDRSGASYHS